MTERPPIPLTPSPIDLTGGEFYEIRGWSFAESFVGRLLRDDIPRRVRYDKGRIWAYRDPGDRLVGFGTLDLSREYPAFSAGRVHPDHRRRGHSGSILRHLVAEAGLMAREFSCQYILYLDVNEDSLDAIALYRRAGSLRIEMGQQWDPEEGGEYLLISRRVVVT